MTSTSKPLPSCENCGKSLGAPASTGRPRRFCDATCRSAARRRRAWEAERERARNTPPPCAVTAGYLTCSTPAAGRVTYSWHEVWTCDAHRGVVEGLAGHVTSWDLWRPPAFDPDTLHGALGTEPATQLPADVDDDEPQGVEHTTWALADRVEPGSFYAGCACGWTEWDLPSLDEARSQAAVHKIDAEVRDELAAEAAALAAAG